MRRANGSSDDCKGVLHTENVTRIRCFERHHPTNKILETSAALATLVEEATLTHLISRSPMPPAAAQVPATSSRPHAAVLRQRDAADA